jgi:ribosomal protein S21
MINVQVEKGGSENNATMIRKFTKRVQEAGILNRVRGLRYNQRAISPYVRKKKTLKSIKHREETAKLIKAGKMNPVTTSRR